MRSPVPSRFPHRKDEKPVKTMSTDEEGYKHRGYELVKTETKKGHKDTSNYKDIQRGSAG